MEYRHSNETGKAKWKSTQHGEPLDDPFNQRMETWQNLSEMRIRSFVLFLLLFISVTFHYKGLAQSEPRTPSYYFSDIEMRIDTALYTWRRNSQVIQNKRQLAFEYNEENAVAEFYFRFNSSSESNSFRLASSQDFEIVDSLVVFPGYARFKIKFRNLTETNFLKFIIEAGSDSSSQQPVEVPLFPHTKTNVSIYPPTDELFIGEEVSFEITTNKENNIVFDNRWTEGLPINYKISRKGAQLLVSLLPGSLGYQRISIPISVKKPELTFDGFVYQGKPLEYTFQVKTGRLAYLQIDKQEITPPDDKTVSIEVQIDNNRNLVLGKTYRIENQENPGGPLIAELFTKTRLNNNKILCLLKVYAFHRKSEGYLYIKDGDEAQFVTNVDVTPKTNIRNIFIQREGKDWQLTNTVFPGETILVKLEGEGLHKANFRFQGAENLFLDSLIRNENMSIFRIRIPVNIATGNIEIFDHRESTGKGLAVSEFQVAKKFDFISLDLGNKQMLLDDISKPIYYEGTLTDLVLVFDRSKIDRPESIFGKQYIKIDVKVSNKLGNLIELYKFDQLGICPAENSPRFQHYSKTDCTSDNINLNNYLSRKTYDLDEWSKIELDISHVSEKHGGQTIRKRVIIYLKRDHTFDIDVSFPGGLLILKAGADDFVNFGGVSFAMLAQFSFYQEGKIAKYKPYKLGAGFIAINAFNFAETSTRDVGLVVMGSLYPTSSGNKLSFPLYGGFGFLMKEKKLFSLIGPGIRVQF